MNSGAVTIVVHPPALSTILVNCNFRVDWLASAETGPETCTLAGTADATLARP